MDFMPLEARKYALRWSIFSAVAMSLGLIIAWVSIGHFPIVDRIRITPSYDWRLPFNLSRWYDGLAIMIPLWLIAYINFRGDAINRRWKHQYSLQGADKYSQASTPIFFGLLIGACGLLPVTPAGFGGIAIATPVVLAIIVFASLSSCAHTYQIVLCCAVVILTIWAGETVLVGTIAGFVYAASILLYTIGIIIGVTAAILTLFFVLGVCEVVIFDLLLPERFSPQERMLPSITRRLRPRTNDKQIQSSDSSAA